jgi:peptide deformylase
VHWSCAQGSETGTIWSMPPRPKFVVTRQMPDPVLTRRATGVVAFDEKLAMLAELMIAIMQEEGGVGLAANQIGVGLDLFVYDARDNEGPKVMVNPRIVAMEGEEFGEEGCLSIRGHYFMIPRALLLTWEGQNLRGEACTGDAGGFTARIIQHEVDHLHGRCLLNYVSHRDRFVALGLLDPTT